MSDANNPSFTDFGKFVPGFDFLQNLAKQAADSAAQNIPQLPKLGNWVAPTLNVEELDKRIEELKAVQFWLDQNAMALKATIQALEVQKMTLATLKGMNFNMGDVANAFKLKVADSVAGGAQRVADKAKTFAGLEVPAAQEEAQAEPAASKAAAPKAKSAPAEKAPAAGGVVDPLQWWSALTQQFQTIAAEAMKDAAKKTAIDTTKNMATGLAKDAVKTATDMATGLAKGMAESAGKTAKAVKSPAPATAKPKAPARKTARKTSP